jgi:mannose-6-phosphate isomerase-like protein (cupin superfamily)
MLIPILEARRDQSLTGQGPKVFAEERQGLPVQPLHNPQRPPWLKQAWAAINLFGGALLLAGLATPASAQRKPSEAKRPFVVMSSQSLDELQKKIQPDNKTEELIDSGGMQLRVAVQHEKNKASAAAELHDASDDVYYVLAGTATLVLGGRLDDPKETDPGEWRSPRIIDGRTVELKKGDLVIVPRGTPHQRTTANQDFTMLLVKIYQEPLKPKPATPSQKP